MKKIYFYEEDQKAAQGNSYTRLLPFPQENDYTRQWASEFQELSGMKLTSVEHTTYERDFEHGSSEDAPAILYTFTR
jgi:hypothetical protein